jgi:hypothetical protein
MNRVKINGVWYVPETAEGKEPFYFDPHSFDGCVVEDNNVCFEASRLRQDDGSLFKDSIVDIKYTNKTLPETTEYWDNPNWLVGILNNDPFSLKDLPEMPDESFRLLHAFLEHLACKGWFDGVKV